MIATKAFATTADVLGPIVVPRDCFVSAAIQYGAGGSGTLKLQGTLNDTDYVDIGLTPAAGGTIVTSVSAAGIWTADVSAYSRVKLIESVNGAVTGSLALASA